MQKATREQTKNHNKTLILNTIYQSAELIVEGLVTETGFGKSAGGKPPLLLTLVDDSRQIIGIDLASGEFRGVLVDLRGKIQERINVSIEERSGVQALEFVYDLIDQLISRSTRSILGIGIGAPGLMDSDHGVVVTAVNLDWEELPLATLLQQRYRLPVYIANDSQISALAEYKFGTSENAPNLLVVKIGRGVGSGIMINNLLYQGDSFGAGEIGHIKVEENGIQCRCGNYGCLETRISSRAIRYFAAQYAAKHPESILNQISASSSLTTEDVLAAYQADEQEIVDYIQEAGRLLGHALSFIVSTLNINTIVIAGSVSIFGSGIIEPALESLQNSTLPALSKEVKMTISPLGEEIVILGAAGLVLRSELGIL